MKLVIPMAGFGTRMRPHTWARPKPLLPLAGRPILDHVLDRFTNPPHSGIRLYCGLVGGSGQRSYRLLRVKFPRILSNRRKCLVKPMRSG